MATIITSDGYAPSVPSYVDVTSADTATLVLVIRDTLQNGASATRANLALSALLERLAIPVPKRELDAEPWESEEGERHAVKAKHDRFKPRFEYSQVMTDYIAKPTEMGWYDDPDGSGQERWYLGADIWADVFRPKPKEAK